VVIPQLHGPSTNHVRRFIVEDIRTHLVTEEVSFVLFCNEPNWHILNVIRGSDHVPSEVGGL